MFSERKESSEKSYVLAVCLSGIFGLTGVHYFYLGRPLSGLFDFSLFLATLYCFSTGALFWAFSLLTVDSVHTILSTCQLLSGSCKDGRGKIVHYPGQQITTKQ